MPRLKKLLKTLAKGGNANLRVFAICFSIALVLWFFQSMGREYTTDIELSIAYDNLPFNKTFSEPATSKLNLKVSGFGWDLMSYKLKFKKPEYIIDLGNLEGQTVVSLSSAKDLIVESIPGLTNILNLQPESINLHLEEAIRKKVPVVSKLKISPATGFGFSAAFPVPDSVEIFGAKNKLDAVKAVFSEEKVIEDAQGEIEVTALLETPEGVTEMSHKEVKMKALLESLTEKDIEVTIKVVGYKGNKKVNIFPRLATLKLQTTLSQFDKIDNSDFEVFVDFSKVDLSKEDLLEVQVNNKSKFIKSFRVHPKYVDYFLED